MDFRDNAIAMVEQQTDEFIQEYIIPVNDAGLSKIVNIWQAYNLDSVRGSFAFELNSASGVAESKEAVAILIYNSEDDTTPQTYEVSLSEERVITTAAYKIGLKNKGTDGDPAKIIVGAKISYEI